MPVLAGTAWPPWPGLGTNDRMAPAAAFPARSPSVTQPKTVATQADPASYLAGIADEQRRADCQALLALMAKASGQQARMWGTAIVGFGVRRYPLAGGKTGEICAVGFSSRKADIAIYGVAGEAADPALLAKLGKHRLGKGCLYLARLQDVDASVLTRLVRNAVQAKPV
jgi:hypothetical protein